AADAGGGLAATGDTVVLAAGPFVQEVGRALCEPSSGGATGDAAGGLAHRPFGGELGFCRGVAVLGGEPGHRAGVEYLDRRDCAAAIASKILCLAGAGQPGLHACRLYYRWPCAPSGQGQRLATRRVRRHLSLGFGLPISVCLVSQPAKRAVTRALSTATSAFTRGLH